MLGTLRTKPSWPNQFTMIAVRPVSSQVIPIFLAWTTLSLDPRIHPAELDMAADGPNHNLSRQCWKKHRQATRFWVKNAKSCSKTVPFVTLLAAKPIRSSLGRQTLKRKVVSTRNTITFNRAMRNLRRTPVHFKAGLKNIGRFALCFLRTFNL